MIRFYVLVLSSVALMSCATKPPVQAMAEARAAVQSVRPLYEGVESKKSPAYEYFQSAEKALEEATKALDEKDYAKASRGANEAKRKARLAAKFK